MAPQPLTRMVDSTQVPELAREDPEETLSAVLEALVGLAGKPEEDSRKTSTSRIFSVLLEVEAGVGGEEKQIPSRRK
jgi:hypothetical protein